RLPVRTVGGCGSTHPSAKARSAIDSSLILMFNAGRSIATVQLPSQGAGQTRPVNSGKLFVFESRIQASFHCPRQTRSFHSGMKLFTGHPVAMPPKILPVWQNGTAQSM